MLYIKNLVLRSLDLLPRYFISLCNLGLISTIKIIFLRIFPRKNKSYIVTNKFGKIYWRSKLDKGVITHFYTPQIGFETNGHDPKIIFDIGANIGIETIRFLKLFPNAKVVSIEAEKENYELLNLNIRNYKNVLTLNAAIWNKQTKVRIKNKSKNSSESFYVCEENNNSSIAEIDALTIETVVRKFSVSSIDILKIDIEGAENIIFDETCDNWISLVKIIVTECPDNDAPFTVMKIMDAFRRNKINFKTYIHGENIVFIREDCDYTLKSCLFY